MRIELSKALSKPAHDYKSQQSKSKIELIQCSSNYKNVPDASNRKKAQLSGGKKIDISQRKEISVCQTGQKRSHNSKNFVAMVNWSRKRLK